MGIFAMPRRAGLLLLVSACACAFKQGDRAPVLPTFMGVDFEAGFTPSTEDPDAKNYCWRVRVILLLLLLLLLRLLFFFSCCSHAICAVPPRCVRSLPKPKDSASPELN